MHKNICARFLVLSTIAKKKQSNKLMSNYSSDAGKKIRTSTEIILHKILSLARLPIPPYPHARSTIHINKKIIKMK